MKLFKRKLQITAFILRFVRIRTACWFNRPRLNQNVSVQATSLNKREIFRETRVKSQSGFTLLELLIVIALMAILWGVAYTMFYQSKKVFSLSANKLEMYQYARIAMDNISRDLKGAFLKDNRDFFVSFPPESVAALSPATNTSFLIFLTLTPNGSSTPATLVAYYLKSTDELIRAEYNDTSYIYGTVSSFDTDYVVPYKLTANTNYFNLEYGTGGAWVSAWNSTGDVSLNGTTTGAVRLPDVVKVTLQIYGTTTGNRVEIGTFTTQIMLPYRITH